MLPVSECGVENQEDQSEARYLCGDRDRPSVKETRRTLYHWSFAQSVIDAEVMKVHNFYISIGRNEKVFKRNEIF